MTEQEKMKKVIKGLECCAECGKCKSECPYDGKNNSMYGCTTRLAKDALEILKDYDHILHLAKAMHTWIFLHTADEFAVYDELGLTDEDNALLGSIGGKIVIDTRKHEGGEVG